MELFHHIELFRRTNVDMDRFVSKEDLDNSATIKILDNKFFLDSDSDDEENEQENMNTERFYWIKQLDNKPNGLTNGLTSKLYIPGLRFLPRYPKLSSLTAAQHEQCLRVLSTQYKEVLPNKLILLPSIKDCKVFEELQETYKAEQVEYISWAKTLWTENHSARALYPGTNVEAVYEAEMKMKARALQMFPRDYVMAAQISLESIYKKLEFNHLEDLVEVDVTNLPHVNYQSMVTKKFSIFYKKLSFPEPCDKHPCKFILPTEECPSELPLAEVHRELAQYALEKGAQCVMSESAFRCLVQRNRLWTLPLSVCEIIRPDGERANVVVFDSEFQMNKETAINRTRRAFKRLLAQSLVPNGKNVESQYNNATVKENCRQDEPKSTIDSETSQPETMNDIDDDDYDYDDYDDDTFVIDTDGMTFNPFESTGRGFEEAKDITDIDTTPVKSTDQEIGESDTAQYSNIDKQSFKSPFYACNCKAPFLRPAPRSYSKWQIKNMINGECYNVIVHSSHKFRDRNGEVVLEPIPEYQLEMGVSELSQDTLLAADVSLMLRRRATYVHVRVDGASGLVVSYEKRHLGEVPPQVNSSVYSVLDQLRGLKAGNYLLQHQRLHGANALLYSTPARGMRVTAALRLDSAQAPSETEEAAALQRSPPTIAPHLLPYHKFRKILPCAFTPNPKEVAKEAKKPVKQPVREPIKRKRNRRKKSKRREKT